jgi:hypothetical protein
MPCLALTERLVVKVRVISFPGVQTRLSTHLATGKKRRSAPPASGKKRRTGAEELVTIAKATLASKSEYFARMFLQDFSERTSERVDIPVNSSEGAFEPGLLPAVWRHLKNLGVLCRGE